MKSLIVLITGAAMLGCFATSGPRAWAAEKESGAKPGVAAKTDPEPPARRTSEFVHNPEHGIDPFFPESKRRKPAPPPAPKPSTTVAPPVRKGPDVSKLELKGFSGDYVLINNADLRVGEEGVVRVDAATRLRVKVLERKEASVVIQVEGLEEPLELKVKQ